MNVNKGMIKNNKLLLSSRSFFIACVLLVLNLSNYAQSYNIKGYIDSGADKNIILCTQFGDFSRVVDTISVDSEGFIDYSIPSHFSRGLYRIYLYKDVWFDLILNNENIRFSTSAYEPEVFMVINESEENKLFYKFKSKYFGIKRKLNILSQVIVSYPDDPFLEKLEKQFNKEKKTLNKHISTITKGKEQLFASKLIHYYSELILPTGISDDELVEFYNDNYWNYFPLEDSDLMNSDAYTVALVGFLKVQIPRNASFDKMQELYINACDNIMLSIRGGDDVYQYVLKYLLDGFEQFEMWDVISYLAETYGGKCTDLDSGSSLSARIKNYTELVKGKKAPTISINDIEGKVIEGFNSKYTLVVFWATWCGHCKVMIPELNSKINELNKLGVDIIGISLDEDIKLLQEFIRKENIIIPMFCDTMGWASPPAIDYAVYATPSMYLVDENGILIGKPMYISDIFETINEFERGY